MKEILILGLGNEILSDDAIGIMALRQIKNRYLNNEKIDFIESAESGISLLDYIIGYQKVLILDSIFKQNESPGTIEEIDISNMKETHYCPKTPHYIGLPYTIKIALNLHLNVPQTIKVLAMNVADPYSLKENNLTPQVAAALPLFIALASAIIEQWL